MDPNTWFNISRFATMFGGLIIVGGTFGLYHFGKLKELNSKKANKKLEVKVQSAKAVAASANVKIKELELDVAEAVKETEVAKEKAERFRLEIQKANLESQKAKVKAEELTLEVEKTKLEAEKARLERDKIKDKLNYIKSIHAVVTYKIPITPVKGFIPNHTSTHSPSPKEMPFVTLLPRKHRRDTGKNIRAIVFDFDNWTKELTKEDLKVITLRYDKPKNLKGIYGERLDLLRSFGGVLTYDMIILERYIKGYDSTKKIEFMFELFVNGIKVIKRSKVESIPGEFFKNNIQHNFSSDFQNIPKILLN